MKAAVPPVVEMEMGEAKEDVGLPIPGRPVSDIQEALNKAMDAGFLVGATVLRRTTPVAEIRSPNRWGFVIGHNRVLSESGPYLPLRVAFVGNPTPVDVATESIILLNPPPTSSSLADAWDEIYGRRKPHPL